MPPALATDDRPREVSVDHRGDGHRGEPDIVPQLGHAGFQKVLDTVGDVRAQPHQVDGRAERRLRSGS